MKVKGLEIEKTTKGNGQDILLLHGWGGNIESLHGLQEQLANKGYRVTNVSLPGFGKSEVPSEPWFMKDYALFIEELILGLKLKKPILVGHSFGGKVGIKMVLEFPYLISKLILINASGIKPKNSLKKLVFGTVSKILGPILPRKLKDFGYKYIVGETDYMNSGNMKETFKNIVNEHFDVELSQIDVPTQIIWSEKDTYVPLWMGERLHSLIPHSSFEIVREATHGLPLTDPKGIDGIINEKI